jgi:osmotically-inducible protein OsmY
MATNEELQRAVRAALDVDKRLAHSEEIAVTADDDVVTLRGTVTTFNQRRAAVGAARKVEGVDYVLDQVDVRLLDAAERSDAELRGMALQSLAWDTEVPAELIDLEVNSGVVTLKGDVSYQFQSDAAYDDVANLFGVIGINNEINVVDAETDEQSKRTSSRAPQGARRAR